MIIGDYEIIKTKSLVKNKKVEFLCKCKICGHEMYSSIDNLKKSNKHNYRKCKEDFFNLHYKEKIFNNVKILRYLKHNVFEVETICCKKIKIEKSYKILNKKITCCQNKKNEKNKNFYFDEKKKKYICKICGGEREKIYKTSQHNLRYCKRNFYYDENPKINIIKNHIKNTFHNINSRCGKHKNYLNIKNEFENWIEFYNYIIKDFLICYKKENENLNNCTIDRIDVYGNYKKGNIRVINRAEQMINTSVTNFFILIDIKNNIEYISNTTKYICEKFNLSRGTLNTILRTNKGKVKNKENVFTAKKITKSFFEKNKNNKKYIPILFEDIVANRWG